MVHLANLSYVGVEGVLTGGRAFQEHPRIGKCGSEHVLEELHEGRQLAATRPVVGFVQERAGDFVGLDHFAVAREQGRVELAGWVALEAQHEVQGDLFLHFEEPPKAFGDILDPPLQREMGLVPQQFHDDVAPRQGAHGDAARLDDVPLLRLHSDFRKAQEDFDLLHHPPERRTSVDLHLKCGEFHLIPQVFEVVHEAGEILGGQLREGVVARMVLVEEFELRLERIGWVDVQGALHDMLQGAGEGHATVARCGKEPVRVGVMDLLLERLELIVMLGLQVLQVGEHRTDRLHKHLLDFLLHEATEALEADGRQVPWGQPLARHLALVLGVALVDHVPKRLGGSFSVRPMRQSERKAHQVTGQVAMAVDPWTHVLWRQVGVVLIQFVADEDGALEFRVELAALLQRTHGRGVPRLLHRQHDVPRVFHEGQVELLDLLGKGLRLAVYAEVAESRQIHDLHVNAAGGLDPYTNRDVAHALAQLLMALPHDLHHLLGRHLLPLAGLLVAHMPLRFLQARDVSEFQHRRPPAAQRTRDEIEGFPGKGLDQPALADRLLAYQDELRHGEIDDAELVLHTGLDISQQVQQLRLVADGCHGSSATGAGAVGLAP
mmetsp:Transcript_17621/g.50143  ORF Transcript_17621/g.50143 Transcript_17621/m.50143 type:complete len:606 (+) Transcript_17621:446-2263(+)